MEELIKEIDAQLARDDITAGEFQRWLTGDWLPRVKAAAPMSRADEICLAVGRRAMEMTATEIVNIACVTRMNIHELWGEYQALKENHAVVKPLDAGAEKG